MILRSVVGKLWLTIIGLVAVVLIILSFLLFQLFDRSFTEQQFEDLEVLSKKLAYIIETHEGEEEAIATTGELVEAYSRMLVVIGSETYRMEERLANETVPEIASDVLLGHPVISRVFTGKMTMVREPFPVRYYSEEGEPVQLEKEMMVVAVPLQLTDGTKGAVVLYQSLDELNETRNNAKQIILYSAGIGIILSTVFAFFLSTRITQPLRQMKKAADRFAKGEFKSQIEIRSRDEIGDLSLTFNHLAERLDDLVRALSHEKEHLYSILRSMADGVVTFDAEGNMILTNPPAQQMIRSWFYEHTKDVQQNGESLRMTYQQVPEPLLSIFQNVVESESEVVADITVQGRTWSVIMDPLYGQNGIRGTVAVMRDMTEERRMDKLRKDFVANVSHELRTPISMLQGYGEALVDDVAESAEERKEIAQIIYDESLRMGRLVNDLLDLASMESGHVDLSRQETDVEEFVERMARKFSALAREREIKILTDIRLKRTVARLDQDRMEQVFTNLIDNAIRHTEKGGTVTLAAEDKEEQLILHIRDTGSGIPQEDLPFVFERFYKANKARTRGQGGTGLGLAIAKNIVQAHQGTISVNSKVGEGTTFTIQLPRK